MTLDESNAPARVLKRAEAIGVNAACRGAGISQTSFYRWRLAFSGTDPMACTRGLGVPRLGGAATLAGRRAKSARRAGLLTECTRQAMWRLRHGRTRHVAASQPPELVCLDTFYIGQLKVVGKVWQVTACDALRRVQRRADGSKS